MEILWQKWPQWKAVSKIGHGSYGSVYKAGRTDQNMDTFSAIKVISVPSNEAELYSIEAEGYNAGQAREYFKKVAMTYVRESEVLKELRGEPNVVSIDDYYIEERKSGAGYDIFIRMELLTPLSHWLRDNSISEESAAKIGIDICTALEACEKHNIIHRDIKPENILCNSEGVFKLGDFGIARNLECLSGSLTRIGSENYIAPEIVYSKKYNGRVDIYSLGLVLYSLLNGRRLPFWPDGKEIITAGERHAAFSRRIKGEKIPPPKHCCAKLAKIILKACAFDPDDRYSSAKEMKKELEAFLEPVPKAKPAKRSVRFVTAALVALVLTAGVCFGISKLPRAADTQKDGKTASVMDELADPADFDRTEPTEPDPVEPEPVEPDPTEPEPVEPEPVEPEPVEPDPVEPDPTEPEPVEPEPVEPDPVEPDPVEPDPVEPQPADIITLDRSFAALGTKGETLQLTASGVSGGNGGGAFKWESSANSVVTVDQNGLVTAVSNGIARITAQTYDGSSKATCKIIVRLTDNVDLEYFGYNVSNGEATITAVDTAISGDITIPTALGGYPVTAIGAQAFYGCRDVTGVTIPEGITTIGYYAFRNCHNIKSVSIPLSVTAIGDSAFWDCNMLETVYIPASVTDIGDVAFEACNSLTSINVDTDNPAYKSVDGVLYTKDGKTLIQYPRKKSGESYNIPANVTQIGEQAFGFCRDLIAVTVPAGVTAIGFSTFSGCDKLASVNVDAGNPVYKSQGGVLYSKDGKTLICYPGGRDDKSFTVPAEVTSIYQSAFYDCENLRSIFIHSNVSHIGSDAFTRCDNLTIYSEAESRPAGWEENWNYSDCPVVWGFRQEAEDPTEPEPVEPEPVIPEPVIPEPVEPEPVIPEPVEPDPADGIILNKTSATLAFTGQTLQLTASISSGADMMLDWESSDHRIAAVDRSGLVTAVSGGTAIITAKTRDGSFSAGCAITVQSPDRLESKDYAYIVTNGKAAVVSIDKAISGEVVIPATLGGYPVVEIGNSAFYNCRNVTSVVIPEGVVYIDDEAFCYCYSLKSVSIPQSVTAIGSRVFWDCNVLETVYIPANVTSIGEMAFSACEGLTSINVDAGNTAYKSVDGVLYTKDGQTLIQYPRNKSGEIYNIPTDVTEIEKRAFWFCHDLTVVNIPASVATIGDGAFTGCRFLSEINVDEGNGVYSSADGVLYSKDGGVLIQYPCGNVNRSFEILPGVTSIYRSAFYDCGNIRSIFIHKNVSHIGSDAFTRCDNLTIYSEAESQPQLWEKGWNYSERPVVWGYGTEIE